ncbi:DNA polymerase I, partial [Halomonas sp. ATBC28]|uniref:5'-3' exonuclease H3TH domain-containing protein n=1 Tax=Halomonas sp. ATBC28 TaxID=2545264 RepID=UPI001D6A8245
IPGVPGVGEKTAIKLLKEFDSLEKLVESIDQVSGKKLKEKLEEFKDQALMSKELATITRKAPLTITLEDTEFPGMQIEKLKEMFKELGFNSLLEKLGETPEQEELVLEDINFETVENITEAIFSDINIVYAEVLEDNYHYAPILGISLLNDTGAYYLPI